MVHVVTKRTSKKRFDDLLKKLNKRKPRKGGADVMKYCGKAPLHMDPVEFQRALRDEE